MSHPPNIIENIWEYLVYIFILRGFCVIFHFQIYHKCMKLRRVLVITHPTPFFFNPKFPLLRYFFIKEFFPNVLELFTHSPVLFESHLSYLNSFHVYHRV